MRRWRDSFSRFLRLVCSTAAMLWSTTNREPCLETPRMRNPGNCLRHDSHTEPSRAASSQPRQNEKNKHRMRKLFGTDGIRAVAGEAPLDPRTIYAVGMALAHQLKANDHQPSVVLGMDTRESCAWIAAVLTAGLVQGGASVQNAGVITTPAIAYLARKHKFSAGVVISASHNPWHDNGIKIFGGDGYKLPDETELRIEDEIFRQLESVTAPDPADLSAPPVDPALLRGLRGLSALRRPGTEAQRSQTRPGLCQRSRLGHRAPALRAPRRQRPAHPCGS